MSNLFELVKVNLRETLDVRKFKEDKGKAISFLLFIILMGSLFLFLSSIYNISISFMLYELNVNLINSTILMSSVASLLCFSTSVFQVKGIFVGKDYDILCSMPIRKRDIVISKIINLYIYELLFSLIILLPNLVINLVLSSNFIFVPIILVSIFLVPVLPIMLAGVIALFISLVADRFRFGNVINVIMYLLLFIGIFFLSFLLNSSTSDADFVNNILTLTDKIIWVNPTNYFILLSIDNILWLLVFIAINIVLLFIISWFISAFYDKLHSLISTTKSETKYVRKKLEVKTELKTLMWNEFKRFFSSKVYFINCISSGICAIIMAVFTSYMFSEYSYIEDATSILPYVKEYAYFAVFLIMFGIGIATPASASISIEGTTFWITKSYPIDYKVLMKAKILVSTIVLGICSLIASVIVIILIKPTVIASILLIVLPIVYVFLVSVIGLRINLSFPKMKWKSEQEVVKQGGSLVLSMFLDWLIMIMIALPLVLLSIFVNPYVAGIVTFVLMVLVSVVLYKDVLYCSDRKISQIEDF